MKAIVTCLAVLFVLAGCASSTSSTRVRGQEIFLRYASVTAVERVPMPSAAPAGAMVGGFTGLILARNRSAATTIGAGVAGAALGALATRALEGDRLGYAYDLSYAEGARSRFITEKGFLQVGDCVVVERGQYSNLRRVSASFCSGTYQPSPADVASAEQCQAAKQQLLDAQTQEAIDGAARKVELLCQFSS